MKYLKPRKDPRPDEFFFPMAKVPDLVERLQQRTIDYRFVLRMKDAGRFTWLKYRNRLYIQIESLAEWIGVQPGQIRACRDEMEGASDVDA